MKVEVALTQSLVPEGLEALGVASEDVAAVVIDVVRATSVVCTALGAGALGVRPVAGVEQARTLAAASGALLVGERGGLPPEGFDLGNSPRDFTRDVCAERELVLTTTNGTQAVQRCVGDGSSGVVGRVLAASFLNAEATARALVGAGHPGVLLVCAGSGGRVAADDVAAAGCLAGSLALLGGAEAEDGARTAAALFEGWKHDLPGLLRRSLSGRKLAAVNLAQDLVDCARVDNVPVIAELDGGGVFRSVNP